MTHATLFTIANALAASAWLVLAANALMRRGPMLWPARIVPLALSLGYVAAVASQLPKGGVDFGSLAGVQSLFGNPWWTLAGWVHYLAFDLLVGSWEAREAPARGVPRALLLVCLFLTFMFGPVGWLLFIVSSHVTSRPGADHAR